MYINLYLKAPNILDTFIKIERSNESEYKDYDTEAASGVRS